LMSTATVIHPF